MIVRVEFELPPDEFQEFQELYEAVEVDRFVTRLENVDKRFHGCGVETVDVEQLTLDLAA